MESYSIEDIEMIRSKSGLSYQEAVSLLDYHNGSLTRALIDLEKSGKLKENAENDSDTHENKKGNTNQNEFKGKFMKILQKLYRNRIKIQKDNTPVVNLSVLFAGACLLFAPHMTIIGIIISMILGYRFSFSSMDPAFSNDTIEKMVRNAAQNAKSSVSSVVQNFTGEQKENARKHSTVSENVVTQMKNESKISTIHTESTVDSATDLKKQTEGIEHTLDSFFESNPAATSFHSAYSAATSSVPTIQVPVQAETREGTVEIDNDQDGFSSVTIG